jgi:CheY-like chemotaxis protein
MEVFCESCEKKIKIAEDKIPSGKSFSARCPSCKGIIKVIVPAETGKGVQSGWDQDDDGMDENEDYDANEKPFDFLEEEGLTAMVCEKDPEAVARITEVLNIMEYSVTVPRSIRDALRKMKYHVYDLIIVNESFDGCDPHSNGIMIYLERMNMALRRNIFVGLITKQYATRDNMAAFLKSVNLTINWKDVLRIDRVLKNAINDNDLFFTVLKESMRKIGRI